ncbi:DinB family protein [Sabulibacter ruber]
MITHEFHHKGQIPSLGRHLGFVPDDTDVVRQDDGINQPFSGPSPPLP